MAELNLAKGLKATLGDETVAKLTALKDVLEESDRNLTFSAYTTLSNAQLISITRKRIKMNQFLKDLKNINEKHTSKASKEAEIKNLIENFGNLEQFKKEFEDEIKAVKTALEEKVKENAVRVNEQTKEIAESADHRIVEDIDFLKQQKQELFQEREKLIKDIKDTDKALVKYDQKKGFFASFREARNKVDEKTGKKPGLFASIKAAFVALKGDKDEESIRQKDALYDKRIEIEDKIATCEAKIVKLSDQRKEVKEEILNQNTIIANALKNHLENAKNYKAHYNELQVSLNEKDNQYMELLVQERMNGKNDELTAKIEALGAEMYEIRNKMFEANIGAATETRKGTPTVENILQVGDEELDKLREQKAQAKDEAEDKAIVEKMYEIEEQQRDVMEPIVAKEKEAFGVKTEEVVEEVPTPVEALEEKTEISAEPAEEKSEMQAEPKKELTSKELIAKYEKDRERMQFAVECEIEKLEKAYDSASEEKKKEIDAALTVLNKKKEEYEKPLGRRQAIREARAHYGISDGMER